LWRTFTPAAIAALTLSLQVAVVAVAGALPLAVATAFLLARGRFPGRAFLDSLVHLPLVLPPVVMGYLLLITFGTRAPLGAWLLETFGFRFAFSWTGAALAAAIITFPFQVRAIRLSIEAIDPGLSQAAETLGAGPLDRFVNITLPLAIYTAIQTPGGEMAAARLTALAIALAVSGLVLSEFAAQRVRRLSGR
jgi:molybdate transport system permease protein